MKRLITLTCLVVLLGAVCYLARGPSQPPPTAPVVVMPLPYKIPPQKISLFERWAPRQPAWGWLWRLKDTIAGRRKVCDFSAMVVDFADSVDAFLANRPLPAPAFTGTNGLRIWLLSETETSALGRSLRQKPGPEVLCIPRITTADGMQACLFSGNTFPAAGILVPVGLSIDLLPCARPTGTDVTTMIKLTEVTTNQASMIAGEPLAGAQAIRTNLEVAARLQVPRGSGAFVLEGSPGAGDKKRIGVLLSINMQKPKK